MDNKLIFVLFASVILSGVRSVDVKTNHVQIDVDKDDSFELVCSAPNVAVKGCAFTTPSGKTYILWAGAAYEAGRVTQKGDPSTECAISVTKSQDSDNGKWKCQISSMDANNEATTGTAEIDVTIAVPPANVQLRIEKVNAPSEYSVKMGNDGKEVAVECIAVDTRPKPEFKWFLGEDALNGAVTPSTEEKDGGKKDYIETLKYYPDQDHDGKTLKCQVIHSAYSEVQKEAGENEAKVVLKVQYPPSKEETIKEHYNLNVGQENTILMAFSANPKPTEGIWTINETTVPIGAADVNNKYISTAIEPKDGAPGQWKVSLKITKLTEEDVKGKHTLTVKNAEGETTYNFQLHRGEAPPPAKDSNSLTVGIIVIIVIIVLILIVVIVARAKGMLCFAAKGGDELDEEKEAFENVEKGESNAIVQDSKPLETKGTPEKKLDQDEKAEKEEKKSNGAHTPV